MKANITHRDTDNLKISWQRDDQGMDEFGELNFHWEKEQGIYSLDAEMLGMDSVIKIIKALPDEKS